MNQSWKKQDFRWYTLRYYFLRYWFEMEIARQLRKKRILFIRKRKWSYSPTRVFPCPVHKAINGENWFRETIGSVGFINSWCCTFLIKQLTRKVQCRITSAKKEFLPMRTNRYADVAMFILIHCLSINLNEMISWTLSLFSNLSVGNEQNFSFFCTYKTTMYSGNQPIYQNCNKMHFCVSFLSLFIHVIILYGHQRRNTTSIAQGECRLTLGNLSFSSWLASAVRKYRSRTRRASRSNDWSFIFENY